jgi:soluble lytic murein transglycosylase-like protein
MRLFAIGAAAILAVSIAAEAKAQESKLQLDVESVNGAEAAGRTPMLIMDVQPVKETPKPLPAAPQKNSAANKAAGSKALNTPAAPSPQAASQTAGAPRPIVIAGASDVSYDPADMTTGNPKYDQMVVQSAAVNGVDPALMFAVMRQESGYNSRARSYKGACGLMQLMPGTARRFGVSNIFDPAQNIEGGARYLRFLLDKFDDDVKLTLAGYNAGEVAVVEAGYKVPRYRETQAYVRNISAKYGASKHRGTNSGREPEPRAPKAMVVNGGSSSRLSNNY